MFYARIILDENNNIQKMIDKLSLKKKSEFAFYDLIYLNRNGASITEDTLKIRVYQKNEWNTKDVLVIRKTAFLINGVKEDKVTLKEEFDNVEDALLFVNKNFKEQYDYKLKIKKTGIEYQSQDLRVWIEDIENLGISIEFGSSNMDKIEEAITLLQVKERLSISIPEYLYNLNVKK